jgi:P27 family predicted phage terminase small subunit
MGFRGPAKTPTELLLARGNPHAKHANPAEPIDAVAAPEMPAGLSNGAQAHWGWIVPRLLARRTLAEADLGLLASMCVEYAEYMEAVADLQKLKKSRKAYKGHLIDHPRVRMKGAFERYKQASDRFGLSPSAKARIQATPEEKKPAAKPTGLTLRIAQ